MTVGRSNAMPAAMTAFPVRAFSDAAVVSQQAQEGGEVDIASENARLGIDTEFSQQKHAYVLAFPWNFDEIIDEFQARHRPLSGGFWSTYVRNSGAFTEFNQLFREFHQFCSIPDEIGIEKICEGRLARAVNDSLDRIHFHGLDIEMANLTVEQPNMQILKVELNHGLDVERGNNGEASEWVESKSSLLGASCNYFTPAQDTRDLIDGVDAKHRPYSVAVTMLIESPMKMFVQNQNYSKILLGTDNDEMVKNVVRFETNLKWTELFDVLPTGNKAPRHWRITDFNNIMNENPHF